MIRHTVAFSLRHAQDSEKERGFLHAAAKLSAIHGVQKFEVLRQVSMRNDYDFGLSMEFADQAAYDHYNTHPMHAAFLKHHWVPDVTSFLEIDYEPL